MKIKICAGWETSEKITKRLLDQFTTEQEDIENLEFVYNESYDIIVYNNYISEPPKTGSKAFLFFHEPSWSGSHQKSFENINNLKVFGFDKNYYNPKNVVEETIAHMFYGGRGPWEEGFDNWNYTNLTTNSFSKTKNICSFISNRGLGEESYPEYCLYKERIDLVQNLSSYLPFIDFYGWGEFNNLKPFARQKYGAIKDYRFCLTIENSREKNYLSEKFYDCILTNTIPIYYGCSNIKDYWPEDCYFLLESITDHKYLLEILNYININSDKLYKQMLPSILKMKIKYFNDFNLITKIINSIN
jgi:hypothetical protein